MGKFLGASDPGTVAAAAHALATLGPDAADFAPQLEAALGNGAAPRRWEWACWEATHLAVVKTVLGPHFREVNSPPILEPILVGIGMFTGGMGF